MLEGHLEDEGRGHHGIFDDHAGGFKLGQVPSYISAGPFEQLLVVGQRWLDRGDPVGGSLGHFTVKGQEIMIASVGCCERLEMIPEDPWSELVRPAEIRMHKHIEIAIFARDSDIKVGPY